MKYALLVYTIALITIEKANPTSIETKIHEYFNSDLHKEFDKVWQKYKGAFENSIGLTLQQTFGFKSVNVLQQRYDTKKILSDGVYANDNVVKVLLKNLTLREMPFLRQPDVTFNLPDHELRVDSALSKIFVEAEYTLYRNRSNVVYTTNLDPQTHSPFSSSQVHTSGLVSIVAHDCSLNGNTLATLGGSMVHLMHNNFKVQNCRFFIEIYRPETGNPPVMAPYFSLKQGIIIERVLSPVIAKELQKCLEGAVTATINTTSIFGHKLLARVRRAHKSVFRETLLYLRKVVSSMNRHTRESYEGGLQLLPLEISWDDISEGEPKMNKLLMNNLVLYGLDTAYSSAQGGPIQNPSTRIIDKIRFSLMKARGTVTISNNSTTGQSEAYEFELIMKDFGMLIRLNVDTAPAKNKKNKVLVSKGMNKFEVLGWRKVEYSILNAGAERWETNALAVGYFSEEVPKMLVQHFYEILETVIADAEGPLNDPTFLAGSEDGDKERPANLQGKQLPCGNRCGISMIIHDAKYSNFFNFNPPMRDTPRDTEVPSSTTQSPTTTTEIPTTTQEPITTTQSPTATTEIPTTTQEPITTTQSPTATTEIPTTTQEPTTTTEIPTITQET